jgi:hypothetical protein
MKTVRTTLRRLLGGAQPTDTVVHFHRRSDAPEPCYDSGCTIPRLTV